MSEEFFDWVRDPHGGGCAEVRDLGDGFYAAIKPLMYHWTMIVGEVGDYFGYEDRWCYADRAKAETGLRGWSGEGDPSGWHRHPRTARRRPDGDPSREYIAS